MLVLGKKIIINVLQKIFTNKVGVIIVYFKIMDWVIESNMISSSKLISHWLNTSWKLFLNDNAKFVQKQVKKVVIR